MKKRFLSILLALCIILPCATALTSCVEQQKADTLAGKTIVYDKIEDIVWDAHALYVSRYFEDELYEVTLTASDVLQMF